MSGCALKLLVTFALFASATFACPSQCVCKWKNGKQTVECNDKGLLSIPGEMDASTQVLDFSGNSLGELHAETFLRMDLINLQRLYLSRCRLERIEVRTFSGLTNLVELDLSGNSLEVVPTDAFADCPSLMRLTLSANPIKTVKRGAFSRLSFLNTLELSDCEVSEVEADAFQGLHSLEWLRLDGNRLRRVRGGSRALPENLRGVELQGNPWECDCHLLGLHEWLEAFSMPNSVEPVCAGPSRLANRAVKSIPAVELACLPDVTPTTFYLEIAEGKNVSFMCNVHAVPEARVSWWFQGQHLQNDTLVSPGLRLLYYIEEGVEDKRSELFIYNANAEDNGTFICTAENPAGAVSSNYTIRIIVKEEPIVIIVAFPFEYLMAGVIGACALFIIIMITVIACVIRCRRNRRRQEKREKTKEVALQYQQNSKCAMLREDNTDQHTESLKQNINEPNRQQDIMFYSPPLSKDVLRTMSPVAVANQMRSPISLRRYQLEQNPDLINDTESGARRRDGDGEDGRDNLVTQTEQMMHPTLVQIPIACMRSGRKLYSLHSWDAGCSMDTEGYPADYGLPKLQNIAPDANFYRTLPYNRAAKRQSAANPPTRFSREAEFLSRSAQPASYEHYCSDVRYTADGYPARPGEADAIASPPEGYKTDAAPASLPCTSAATQMPQWPPHVPANMHMINPGLECNQSKYAGISKRCVGAQTDTADKTEATSSAETPNDVLTESPDEGYEGEPGIVH